MGCATGRVVRLEMGDGTSLVYEALERVEPIAVPEDAFRQALARLVLDVRLVLHADEAPRSRVRLASTAEAPRGVARSLGGRGVRGGRLPRRACSWGAGDLLLDVSGRRRLALSFAWDGVWDGVEAAVLDVMHPLTLEVMGTHGARVLVLALTAVLGGGVTNLASNGASLPGFARAALAAETNAGLRLSAAMTGGVRSFVMSESGLIVAVAPTAVAAVAWDGGRGEPRWLVVRGVLHGASAGLQRGAERSRLSAQLQGSPGWNREDACEQQGATGDAQGEAG